MLRSSKDRRPTPGANTCPSCLLPNRQGHNPPVFHPTLTPSPPAYLPHPHAVYIPPPTLQLSPPPPNQRTIFGKRTGAVVKRLWAEGSSAGDFSNRNVAGSTPGQRSKTLSTRITGGFSYPTTTSRPARGVSRRAFCGFIFLVFSFFFFLFRVSHSYYDCPLPTRKPPFLRVRSHLAQKHTDMMDLAGTASPPPEGNEGAWDICESTGETSSLSLPSRGACVWNNPLFLLTRPTLAVISCPLASMGFAQTWTIKQLVLLLSPSQSKHTRAPTGHRPLSVSRPDGSALHSGSCLSSAVPPTTKTQQHCTKKRTPELVWLERMAEHTPHTPKLLN